MCWSPSARSRRRPALLADYPHLEARDEEVVVRLRDRESAKVLIDLMKPHNSIGRRSNTRTPFPPRDCTTAFRPWRWR